MLDKIVHAHLDQMDALEDEIQNDIDKIFKTIDIKSVMSDPYIEIAIIAEAVKHILVEKYIKRAIEQGKKFSDTVDNLKRDIIVQDSKDPNLNEALIK